MSKRRRSRRRVAATGVACAVLGGLLAGCISPRDTLGSNASPCFRVLAVAKRQVEGEGRFDGVRSLRLAQLAASLRTAMPHVEVPQRIPAPRTLVCVVSYRGSFDALKVTRGWRVANSAGDFALVVVRLSDNRVLDAWVLERSPFGFSKTIE